MKNTFQTALLLTALAVFLLLAGGYIGGRNGLLVTIIVAVLMNFVSYFYSDRIALALYRVQPLTPGQLPHLHRTVERLAQRAGLPLPKIYMMARILHRVCDRSRPTARLGSHHPGIAESTER